MGLSGRWGEGAAFSLVGGAWLVQGTGLGALELLDLCGMGLGCFILQGVGLGGLPHIGLGGLPHIGLGGLHTGTGLGGLCRTGLVDLIGLGTFLASPGLGWVLIFMGRITGLLGGGPVATSLTGASSWPGLADRIEPTLCESLLELNVSGLSRDLVLLLLSSILRFLALLIDTISSCW